MGLGAEGGEEGRYAVDDAEEVGVHYLYIQKNPLVSAESPTQ